VEVSGASASIALADTIENFQKGGRFGLDHDWMYLYRTGPMRGFEAALVPTCSKERHHEKGFQMKAKCGKIV
jgi:hypothetical protein